MKFLNHPLFKVVSYISVIIITVVVATLLEKTPVSSEKEPTILSEKEPVSSQNTEEFVGIMHDLTQGLSESVKSQKEAVELFGHYRDSLNEELIKVQNENIRLNAELRECRKTE